MSGLHDHLDRAAGEPGPDLDLGSLHQRARTRRTRRRAAAGGLAVAGLLGVAGLVSVASSGAAPRQQVTASEGEGTTSTAAEPEATTTQPTSDTTEASDGATTTSTPVEEAPPTTAPEAEPTTTVPAGDPLTLLPRSMAVAGTYEGLETYAFGGACTDLSHHLEVEADMAGEDWSYVADYCGHFEGDTWFGVGAGTMTTDTGDTFTVAIDHTAPRGTTGKPYDVTVTGGTGRYDGATGTCSFTIAITPAGPLAQAQTGTLSCEIDLAGHAETLDPAADGTVTDGATER